jgi:hypothetical protein
LLSAQKKNDDSRTIPQEKEKDPSAFLEAKLEAHWLVIQIKF